MIRTPVVGHDTDLPRPQKNVSPFLEPDSFTFIYELLEIYLKIIEMLNLNDGRRRLDLIMDNQGPVPAI